MEEEKIFYKKKPTDKVYWVETIGVTGRLEISFDKKKIINLWQEYPKGLTAEQKQIFDKENPYWKKFFRGRSIT